MGQLVYTAGGEERVTLRGPTGLRLQLGPPPGRQLIAWEPEDRRQCEVEVRARLMSCDAVIGTIPIVRCAIEFGHAEQAWSAPPTPFPQVSGAPFLPHSLPARGALWRLDVRELRLAFLNGGLVGGGAYARGELDVSIQPALGQHVTTLPWSSYVAPAPPLVFPFPCEAREWRCMDDRGLPLAIGAVALVLTGAAGALIAAVDAALYADWNPIPHDAAGWVSDAPHWVAFR